MINLFRRAEMRKKRNWSDIIDSRYEKLKGDNLSKMSVSEILEMEEIPEFGSMGILYYSGDVSPNHRYIDDYNEYMDWETF